jgi:hypothetical protein
LSVGGNIEGTISISVPEPVSMAMLSLAAPTILMRRRARNA